MSKKNQPTGETLKAGSKTVRLPIFLPDGTRGVVRSLDSRDLENIGIDGIVVNTFHLMQSPGDGMIKRFGGIHAFMDFPGLVISDSGGFQVLSLIYEKNMGKITDEAVVFYTGGNKKPKKEIFTPAKSIQVQFNLGSDLMICLDDCASERLPRPDHEQSVQRTISWAKQCQKEFQKQLKLRRVPDRERPLLFAVIQGGNHKDLRSQCAAELVKIGFDGYGFGGWPMLDGKINYDILSHTANTMPDDFPKYALGVGKPDEIIVCARMGYSIFDCVLPTRDARHQRLYIAKKEISKIVAEENPKEFFSCLDIQREIYYRDTRPLSEFCQCSTCLNYSRAYLRHLFQIKETAAFRLATIHNLQVYTDTINALRSLKH